MQWSAKLIMSSSMPPHRSLDDMNDLRNYLRDNDDDDADTASQRSISLSSPPSSPRHSSQHDAHLRSSGSYSQRESHSSTDYGSEADNMSLYNRGVQETPSTSAAPSVYDEPKDLKPVLLPTYPPTPPSREDAMSISSYASGSSRKTRPESLIVVPTAAPLVLGIALVDFNHLVLHKTTTIFMMAYTSLST